MIIPIVGPSRAGKTALLSLLNETPDEYGLNTSPPLMDLDRVLGSGNRSNCDRAVKLIRCVARETVDLVVDVGAGQIVQPPFRNWLFDCARAHVIVVWCDEATFRSRHGRETADREFQTNFEPELRSLWQASRHADLLVDTSAPRLEVESAKMLGAAIGRVKPDWAAPVPFRE